MIGGDIRIRPGSEDDVDQVMALVRASPYLQCHTEHTYWILLRYGGRYTYVAEDGRRILGYASGVRSNVTPNVFFLWQMIVSEPRRRLGIAMALLRKLVAIAEADGCDEFHAAVAVSNHPARNLLERWAFETDRNLSASENVVYAVDNLTTAQPYKVVEQLIIIRG